MRAKLINEYEQFVRTGSSKDSLGVGRRKLLDGKLHAAEGSEYMVDEKAEKDAFVEWSWDSPEGTLYMEDGWIDDLSDYQGEVSVEISNGDLVDYEVKEIRTSNGPDWVTSIKIEQEIISTDRDEISEYFTVGSWFLGLLNFYKDWYINKRNK